MRASLIRVAAVLVMTASMAHACLNDREILIAEQEFRSAYIGARVEMPTSFSLGGVAMVVGIGLLVLSARMLLKKPPVASQAA